MSVRSVAVHPENPRILLRGGGAVENGELRSGLWRSEDAGRTWILVSEDIDFDGTGPAAIFGETICFDQHDPNVVVAAGESSGLYASTDAGKTWSYHSLKGERISALSFYWKFSKHLFIGTCPDSALTGMGLPDPRGNAEPRMGKFIRADWRPENLRILQKHERPDWGVTVFAQDRMAEGPGVSPIFVGTTQGLFYTFNYHRLYQLRVWDPADRFLTAFTEMPRDQGKGRSEYLFAPFQLPGDPGSGRYIYKGFTGFFWNPTWLAHQNPGGVKHLPGTDSGIFLRDGVRDLVYIGKVNEMADKPDAFLTATAQGVFKTTDNGRSYRQVWKTSGN
jgi:hypothetical protein